MAPLFSPGYTKAIARHWCAKPTISMITKTVEPRRANRSSFYLVERSIESVLALRSEPARTHDLDESKRLSTGNGAFHSVEDCETC